MGRTTLGATLAGSVALELALAPSLVTFGHAGNSSTSVIHACVTATNAIRYVSPTGDSCPDGQRALHWSVRGPEGDTGTTGPRGATGPRGLTGRTGPQGPRGNTGITGADGTDGTNGSAGPQGDTGAQGPRGDTGADGTNGTNGSAGPQGDTGAAGIDGTDGDDGAAGPTGDTGIAGANGAAGPQGATGNAGSQGGPGPQGATGTAGPQGSQGSQGSQGIAGPTGATGVGGPAGPRWSTYRRSLTSLQLGPGGFQTLTVTCDGGSSSGDFALNGGYSVPDGWEVSVNQPGNANFWSYMWTVTARPLGSNSGSFTAYVVCADIV